MGGLCDRMCSGFGTALDLGLGRLDLVQGLDKRVWIGLKKGLNINVCIFLYLWRREMERNPHRINPQTM